MLGLYITLISLLIVWLVVVVFYLFLQLTFEDEYLISSKKIKESLLANIPLGINTNKNADMLIIGERLYITKTPFFLRLLFKYHVGDVGYIPTFCNSTKIIDEFFKLYVISQKKDIINRKLGL